ncbi:type VII secretion protein EccE [Streptomyces oceani]|uniref:Type VII secretion system protein EccE domain-containing protein n=1 Tax=Streptomyces oceani TaxID=1075402 RepID=A0A1E7JXI5_9ACTN|nr:type VII secretion protein EccE [Streptomyces oceani]OEU96379.1 hypothetical protein AN216_20460 [Streptomyces oceani]
MTTADPSSRASAARKHPFSRGRVIALETAVGCVAAGVAYAGAGGYLLAAAGAAIGALTLLRWGGRTASGHLVRWLRGQAFAAVPTGAADAAVDDFGLAGALLPELEVTEVTNRNGPAVGVLGDGRGFAAVLELPSGFYPDLPAEVLGRWLAEDPARPATAQLLVEQHGLPSWDFHQRFEPTLAYRQLSTYAPPLAVRTWLVVRYEPWEAPEAAASRGGGAAGARAAVVAATARLQARLRSLGVTSQPLGGDRVRTLLKQLGSPNGTGRALADSWAEDTATHCLLTADIGSTEDWRGLMGRAASCGVDRLVMGATFSREDGELEMRCAVRLVSSLGQRAAVARDHISGEGSARPMTGSQEAGLLATLPVSYPSRSLVAATGFATGVGEV